MFDEKESSTSKAASRVSSSSASAAVASSNVSSESLHRRIESECDVIVVDVGSGSIKCGWAGEDSPRIVVPTLIVRTNGRTALTVKSRSSRPTLAAAVSTADDTDADSAITADDADDVHRDSASYLMHTAALAALASAGSAQPTPTVIRPIRRGEIVDFGAVAKLIDFAITQLGVSAKDHSLLLAVSPLISADARDELANAVFTHLNSPALLIANTSSTALFSTGRTTGIVVDIGHGLCTVLPVYHGAPLLHAVQCQAVSGVDVTAALRRALANRGYDFTDAQDELVRDIKEKLCAVKLADDAAAVAPTGKADDEETKTYELPDGTVISVDRSCRFDSAEVLFRPTLIPPTIATTPLTRQQQTASKSSRTSSAATKTKPKTAGADGANEDTSTLDTVTAIAASRSTSAAGLSALIADSLLMVEPSVRRLMAGAIVLCGGASMTDGTHRRIRMDIVNGLTGKDGLQPSDIVVVSDSRRGIGGWIGASMLGSLCTFNQMKITADAYKRDPTIVAKRVF